MRVCRASYICGFLSRRNVHTHKAAMKLPQNNTLLKLLDAHKATLLKEDATPNFTFQFYNDETHLLCAHNHVFMSNVDPHVVCFWHSLFFVWDERRWRWITDGSFRHTYLSWLHVKHVEWVETARTALRAKAQESKKSERPNKVLKTV